MCIRDSSKAEPVFLFILILVHIVKRIFTALQYQKIEGNVICRRHTVKPVEKLFRKAYSSRYIGIFHFIVNLKHYYHLYGYYYLFKVVFL